MGTGKVPAMPFLLAGLRVGQIEYQRKNNMTILLENIAIFDSD